MNDKLRRNDPCHCGSGKKLKACHGLSNEKSTHFKIIGVILVLFLFWLFFFESESPSPNLTNSPSPFVPRTQTGTSTPSEPAPPGKVWSQEHGHWHDTPSITPLVPSGQSILDLDSQPVGDAPPGKVWSPEHNHWHNKE